MLSCTYQSTACPLLSTLYEPLPKHLISVLGDPTLADAILDRLVHNAYKITLQGESMRKRQARLTRGAIAE